MACPLRIEFPGAFYHVTSVGCGKLGVQIKHRDIFQVELRFQ
jgi:hypothetical protein